MFTFVMRFNNVEINEKDVKWWRRRINLPHNNQPQDRVLSTQGNNILSITCNISRGTLTSVLMINSLTSARVGPYWVGMTNGTQLSNVAFLSIVPSLRGMCI